MQAQSTKELDEVLAAALYIIPALKRALSDGQVTVDEVVNLVSDGKLREEIRKGLEGIEKIPDEVEKVLKHPLEMIMLVQRIVQMLPEILGLLKR